MSEYKDHIVKSFDDDIENIKQLTTQMATLVEEQFKLLYHVIDTASPATIEDILDNEPRLDQYDAEIRDAVITIITLRAPIAIELRASLTALRISTDLERLGEYAKTIPKRISAIETIPATNIKNDNPNDDKVTIDGGEDPNELTIAKVTWNYPKNRS